MDFGNNPTECAPDIKGSVCSRDHIVNAMRQFITESTGKPFNGTKEDTIKTISKILGCDGESCVLSHSDFKGKIGANVAEQEKKLRMNPPGPYNSNALLNNFNIDHVLKLYTRKYPNFHHIPFKMIDFATTETRDFNLANGVEAFKAQSLTFLNPKEHMTMQGKDCCGVVLNTDFSSGGGKHWFCLFFDFRNINHITLEYFNSSGNMPSAEVHQYMVKLRSKIYMEYPKSECTIETVSNKQIQFSQTECGVYSLYYIISRLEGHTLDEIRRIIKTKGIADELMLEVRAHLFRKHK